ncbi:hypothetical protein CMQ_7644 [Grosmannia clavigera kw1407]|uniref:Uncharacterized protein n=1 Tax=Grosmannia clavigera (strain kw1407 / UAMH 11150) TaxID=655863 RepID=F0XPB0_GROCL|nr:uncharacterized protein CMQ_7644 [Grosmannia clavigera kw1407]EFX00642.1 hypothetical protein CMQ_7644 [Grosmannia clavigera kw1407]
MADCVSAVMPQKTFRRLCRSRRYGNRARSPQLADPTKSATPPKTGPKTTISRVRGATPFDAQQQRAGGREADEIDKVNGSHPTAEDLQAFVVRLGCLAVVVV